MTVATISNNTGATYSGVGYNSLIEAASGTPNLYPDRIRSQSSTGAREHGIVIFSGLSNIPTSATVTAASIVMQVGSSGVASVQYDLLKLITPSITLQGAWNYASYSPSVSWSSPGALNATDADLTILASVSSDPVLSSGYAVTFSGAGLLAAVQSMVSTPAGNNGFLIVNHLDTAYDGSNIRFYSPTDTTNGPVLNITYSAGSSFPSASSKRFNSSRHSFGLSR